FPKQRVDVACRDDNGLPELSVPPMAGEENPVAVAREHGVGGVGNVLTAVDPLEIEHAGVERERLLHVSAAHSRDDRHHLSWIVGRSYPCCASNPSTLFDGM